MKEFSTLIVNLHVHGVKALVKKREREKSLFIMNVKEKRGSIEV